MPMPWTDALQNSMLSSATSTNFDHYAQLNIRFYERLFESCARKHLRRQIAMLRDAVSPLI